jgi:hypothetical protein
MTNQCEIIYFLDNNDLALIEVEQGSNGLRSMLWFVYHKASQSISRFSFRPTFSKTKIRGQKIKKGFLKLTSKPGNYSIEIDARLLDFTEQHPNNVPAGARVTIEKYLSTVV